jgi:hypothetical protein
MNSARPLSQPSSVIPPDNPQRKLTVIASDSPEARRVSIGGGSYTILVTGQESVGRYCLIDIGRGKILPDTRGHTRTFTFRK